MKGIVVDVFLTYLRKEPKGTADVEVVIMENAEVEVDLSFEDANWYKVKTATDCIGYAPKNFIALKKG